MTDAETDDLEIELKPSSPGAPSGTGPASENVTIRVVGDVLGRIEGHVKLDTSVEQGGVLVGHVDEHGTTTIQGSIEAVGAVSQVASLTFTHETWDHVNDVLAEQHPDARMVGWYHSHPRFGIFLSDYDQFIHNNFFRESWQVAYVIDPVDGEHGFFGWVDGELVRIPRWETTRIESGRRPETAVGIPVRSEREGPASSEPPAPPVVIRSDDGLRPFTVGVLVVIIALLAATIGYVFGGRDATEEQTTPTPATFDVPEPGPTPGPGPGPDPGAPPSPAPAREIATVACLEPEFWPILRRAPDEAILDGPVLTSGATGFQIIEDDSADPGPWTHLLGPQGEGWVPDDTVSRGTSDESAATCQYAVEAESELYLRSSPVVLDSNVVGVLERGQEVDVTGFAVMVASHPWAEVQAGSLQGFVRADYLGLR